MGTYAGTHSCGHPGEIRIVGCSKKDRDWRFENYFSQECPDCKRKALDEKMDVEFAEAQQSATQKELPTLSGTEKQIRWATILRHQRIGQFEEFIKKCEDTININISNGFKKEADDQKQQLSSMQYVIDYILQHKTSAKFFIDCRDDSVRSIVSDNEAEASKFKEEIKRISEEKEICGTKIIKPETPTHEGIVYLYIRNDIIHAKYIKDDDFIQIMHDKHFKWANMVWCRKITETCGNLEDRFVELANTLLLNGFAVEIPEEYLERVTLADYDPEKVTWVLYNERLGKLAIKLYQRNNDLYEMAKKIKDSRWNSDTSSLSIPIDRYKEVFDFADFANAGISKMALAKIEEYKLKLDFAETVDAKEKEAEVPDDKLSGILTSGNEIIDDLKDEL